MDPPVVARTKVVVGDITKLSVDAVVTAANEALCGGGGVDGAIHRAAGPGLFAECLRIGYCPQGEARLTAGHQLTAKFVIHAVGPVWEGGNYGEAEILASCYRSALNFTVQHEIDSIGFPCIATGVYGYPKAQACNIAVATVAAWLKEHEWAHLVVFCCFESQDAALYVKQLGLETSN